MRESFRSLLLQFFTKSFFERVNFISDCILNLICVQLSKTGSQNFIKNYLSLTKDQTFQCFFLLPFNYVFNYFSFSLAISTLRLKPLLDFVIVCAVICIQLKLGLWCCLLSNCLKFHSYSLHSHNINAWVTYLLLLSL